MIGAMDFFETTTGVILTGGKSRRMGRDKAFIPIDGLPLVERVIRLFTESFATVMIVGGDGSRFEKYQLPHHPDIYPGCALGGLYTGLHLAQTHYIFVSACDIPYPSKEVIAYLLSQREGFDAVVAERPDGLEPLFAVYGKTALETMRQQLKEGNPCILDIFPQVTTRIVTLNELATIEDSATSFSNCNTPEDLARFQTKQ